MARTSPSTEFLYDFLYVDRERLASYFSQFFPEGVLTSISRSSQDIESREDAWKGSAAVVRMDMKHADSLTNAISRQFDPAWVIPVTILNRLDEEKLIKRDLTAANAGDLVLLNGAVQVLDVRMLKEMWQPLLAFTTAQAAPTDAGLSRQQRRANGRKGIQEKTPGIGAGDTLAVLLQNLPHAVQMHFTASGNFCWATLKPESMTTSPDDFALKHGASIPGEWHMLALVDGKPGVDAEAIKHSIRFPTSELTRSIAEMLDQLRIVFGRPLEAYAVTPVMLFRTFGK